MYTILLVIHTILVLFLIVLILIQRSDADGLSGLGGGGGGNMGLLSGRSAGNVLTRTTAILATLFIVSSLTLAIMSGNRGGTSIVDQIAEEPAPAAEQKPAEPSVPKAE